MANGIQLSARMVLATEPISVVQSATTGAITIAVAYDNATIVKSADNKLKVGAVTIAQVTDLQTTINGLNTRIDALESGSVDLSNYTGAKIKMTATGADGIEFAAGSAGPVKLSGTALTFNDLEVLTVNGSGFLDTAKLQLSATGGLSAASDGLKVNTGTGLTMSGNNVALAVATADAIGGVKVADAATSGLTLDGSGNLAVDTMQFIKASEKGVANGVPTLNDQGTIPRSQIGSISVQERWEATVRAEDGVISLTAGQAITDPADIDIFDVILLQAELVLDGETYPTGTPFRRYKKTDNTIADYAVVATDIQAASATDVTAGTSESLYITPKALADSAPTFDGSNITNISGANIGKATTSATGVVQIGSNINVADGVISVPVAAAGTKGVVEAGTNITNTEGVLSVPAAGDSVAGVVQIGTAPGQAVVVQDTNTILPTVLPAAATDALGGVKVAADSAISNTAGALDVKLGTGLKKDTGSSAIIADIDALATSFVKKQAPITLSSSNFAEGKVTVTATQIPYGVHKITSPYTVLPVAADRTATENQYVLDLTGNTAVTVDDWEVIF